MTLLLVLALVYLAVGVAIARVVLDPDEAVFAPVVVVLGPLIAVLPAVVIVFCLIGMLLLWRPR